MKARTVRVWSGVHTWTSLVCTAFLLLLCLTGLPLLFREEIDGLLGHGIPAPAAALVQDGRTVAAPLSDVLAAAQATHPDEQPFYLTWDRDEPARIFVTLAPSAALLATAWHSVAVDAGTGRVLGESDNSLGFVKVMFSLHVDLFAGLPGKLFLGAMGLAFVAALVSGAVLYAPFMRRLAFGTVRHARRRTRWLDIHNVVGIVALTWMLAVSATGVINTTSDLVLAYWKRDELTAMLAPYRGLPPLERLGSIDAAVAAARQGAPGMTPSFVAFPGSPYSTARHYMVFLHGETPLTTRLLKPAMVDAATAQLTAVRDLPWYGKALLISQPLHFGDYGGLPLRIIWAVLDILAIVVLGSGLYLWASRRRSRMGIPAPGEPAR